MDDLNYDYVDVIAKMDRYGDITPLEITIPGVFKYKIEKIAETRHNIKLLDSYCDRYTVLINNRWRYLYYNAPYWFLLNDFKLK